MTLRGFGTEFHDSTISVNGTDQRTFGQDTDSEYDVNLSTSASPEYVAVRIRTSGGTFNAEDYYKEPRESDVLQLNNYSDVYLRLHAETDQIQNGTRVYFRLNGGEQIESFSHSTDVFSKTVSRDTNIDKLTQVEIKDNDYVSSLKTWIEIRAQPPASSDYTVDGVTKTQ